MFTKFARTALVAAMTIGATAATVGVSAPAQAAGLEGASTEVFFDDLDLASSDGAARLDGRIRRAAAKVCGGGATRLPLEQQMEAQACRQAALASARPQIEVAVAAARTGSQYASNGASVKIGR